MGLKGLILARAGALTPRHSVESACRLMHEKKLGAVPIEDKGGLSGIFTYRDLIERVLLAGRDLSTTLLGDVMTTSVDALTVRSTYGEALRLMVANEYTYLPIVDEQGHLEGMLSLRSLLEHRIEHLARELDSMTQIHCGGRTGRGLSAIVGIEHST